MSQKHQQSYIIFFLNIKHSLNLYIKENHSSFDVINIYLFFNLLKNIASTESIVLKMGMYFSLLMKYCHKHNKLFILVIRQFESYE